MVIWRSLLPWLQACRLLSGRGLEGSREEEGLTWELYHSNILTKCTFFLRTPDCSFDCLLASFLQSGPTLLWGEQEDTVITVTFCDSEHNTMPFSSYYAAALTTPNSMYVSVAVATRWRYFHTFTPSLDITTQVTHKVQLVAQVQSNKSPTDGCLIM